MESKGDNTKREAPEGASPPRERRAKTRVRDDQATGKGSSTALSRLRMQERRRERVTPRDDFLGG